MFAKHFLIVLIGLFSIHSFSQTSDTIPPVFSFIPVDTTVTCQDQVPSPDIVTVTDNSGSIPMVYSEIYLDSICTNNMTLSRTWTATDGSGNSVSTTQVVRVRDTLAPVLIGNISDLTIKKLEEVPNPSPVTAIDNCGNVPVDYTEINSGSVSNNQFRITRTWRASDDCGNTVQATQVITIDSTYTSPEDTIAPVLSFIPADIIIACYDMIPAPVNISATDNDGSVPILYSEIILDSICTNEMTLRRTWTATDGSGNSVSTTQTVVVNDTQTPVIICPQDTIIYLDSVNTAVPRTALRPAIGWDNCGDASVSSDSPDSFYVGTTIVIWSITDCTNNMASCQQNIQVLNQNNSGQITQSKDIGHFLDVKVFPNPSNGIFKIQMTCKNHTELSVSVFNSQGGKVFHRQVRITSGIITEDIDLSNIAKGVYQLIVDNGDRTIHESVVIQ